MDIRRHLAVAFPVSSVWFGALVGPSMISGAFAASYFAPYGVIGIFLSMLAMAAASLIIGMGAEVVRKHKVYDYFSYANVIYGRYRYVFTPILECFMVLAMIVGGSAVIAMSSVFFQELFGMPPMIGAVIMSAVSICLVLWGAGLLRKVSAALSVVMICGMIILAIAGISNRSGELCEILKTRYIPETVSVKTGMIGAVSLGFSNSCNALTLCAVEQQVKSKRDSIAIGITSFIMNSTAFILCTLLILPYCPEILTEEVPILAIIKKYLVNYTEWLAPVYMITMLFALMSSGAPQLHAVISRVCRLYPKHGIWKHEASQKILTGIIYFACCTAVSVCGLSAIIGKGYQMLGYLAMPLIVIPICVIAPLKEET